MRIRNSLSRGDIRIFHGKIMAIKIKDVLKAKCKIKKLHKI